MQAMQYTVELPADYNMDIIRKRVRDNGSKTDGFQDLLFKAYLITDKKTGDNFNSYSPLYIWRQTEGMTKFIFDGFYDNIIASFGFKNIEIGITTTTDLSEHFGDSQFVVQQYHDIPVQQSLKNFRFDEDNISDSLGKVVIYNPDKWKYVTFNFLANRPHQVSNDIKIYTLLHLSLGNESK